MWVELGGSEEAYVKLQGRLYGKDACFQNELKDAYEVFRNRYCVVFGPHLIEPRRARPRFACKGFPVLSCHPSMLPAIDQAISEQTYVPYGCLANVPTPAIDGLRCFLVDHDNVFNGDIWSAAILPMCDYFDYSAATTFAPGPLSPRFWE